MRRGSGILLHVTSLPARFGIGDLGPGASGFADFLAETGQSYWQVLPLNPTNAGAGNSPYSSLSSFAGNTLIISPERLLEDGILTRNDLKTVPELPSHRVDFPSVIIYKEKLFNLAFKHFEKKKDDVDFERFCENNSYWLDDFSLFMALRRHYENKCWNEWPPEIKNRQTLALETIGKELRREIRKEKFLQYIFYKQWYELKSYCNERGIQLIGDIPYYVSYDSVDVWANPELFKLDEHKNPQFVAGVPPDYFSATGQLWGNPVYNWHAMQGSGFRWWIKRMKHLLHQFDILRIDHFRGFAAYWEVPAHEETAIHGIWADVPTGEFFNSLQKHVTNPAIIAEDLGLITADVREWIRVLGFPCMQVLMFAFDWAVARNAYAPHNHVRNSVVYTGTHDNNTCRGWFENELSNEDRDRIMRYLGRSISAESIHWELVRLALMSVADLALIPIQDILGLGVEARMNLPSTPTGNWEWRLTTLNFVAEVKHKLREMVHLYGRY
jgi:4-alpha-glucanotransferase